jgi:F0F1-type ATP synthase membrane subunit a
MPLCVHIAVTAVVAVVAAMLAYIFITTQQPPQNPTQWQLLWGTVAAAVVTVVTAILAQKFNFEQDAFVFWYCSSSCRLKFLYQKEQP